MKVVWTQTALANLEDIRAYISADNPGRAASFAREIVSAGRGIGDSPRAFPVVLGLEHLGIRRRSLGRYLILYRIVAEEIEILHVVHGARDYIRALFPDD